MKNNSNYTIKKADLVQDIQLIFNQPLFINIDKVLDKENINYELYLFIILNKNAKIDLNTKLLINKMRIKANIFLKAVLFDKSSLNHNGLIKISKTGKFAKAYLESKAILLSDDSKVISRPDLEIENNEVQASHGSSIGNLNEEEIYYLNTRKISETDAKKLLIKSFFDNQISKINSFKIQTEISKIISFNLAKIIC